MIKITLITSSRGSLGTPRETPKIVTSSRQSVEDFESTIFEKSKKSDFQNAQNILNNNTRSELSARGAKRDVEKRRPQNVPA